MTNVLFVEDEPWGVDNYLTALSEKDFHCEMVEDYHEAVRRLKKKRFDIVSLDIMFSRGRITDDAGDLRPQSIGLKLIEAIRSGKIENCAREIKIVVLTASANLEIEKQVRKLGVSDYLTKPVAFQRVIETFTRLACE